MCCSRVNYICLRYNFNIQIQTIKDEKRYTMYIKPGMATLVSDKVNVETRRISREKGIS